MKKILIYTALIFAALAGTTSCFGDLDQYPHTDTTSQDVYSSAEGYQQVLGGIYAAMIQRISSVSTETRSQNFYRVLWQFQDASTDAMDAIWLSGESLTDVNGLSWSAGDPWVSAMYYHIYNIVAMSNEFIRNASDDQISGFTAEEQASIREWRDEARFLRAYAYFYALDFYSQMPFVSENDPVGSFIPQLYTRAQMFDYLVSELSEIAPEMQATDYGHANRGAAYALLARLYLNGEVYTGEPYYTECIEACKNVLADGYSLAEDYTSLFNADNHLRTNEIIFALACDGAHTTTWDATTFITCGEVIADFTDYVNVYGTEDSGFWNNLRARPELVDAFATGDTRACVISYDRLAYSEYTSDMQSAGWYTVSGDTDYIYKNRSKDITGHDETTSGYRLSKWTNLKDDGTASSKCSDGGGADTDIPVFRLADVYLMIAEAVVRGGEGASRSEALDYVNQVRSRAYGHLSDPADNTGKIADGDLTLDFLCNERLRELYMECIRRTDLIRFGKYTSGYNWQWKGNVEAGTDVDPKYRFLPIPEAEYSVNPELREVNASLGY